MRINNEIDAEEYAQRKKEQLIVEEQRYRPTHCRCPVTELRTWLDKAEKLFSFAETAKTAV